MDKELLQALGQWIASGIVLGYAFIKGIKKAYEMVKDLFEKKKKQNKNSEVTVNISNPCTSFDLQEHSKDCKYFLYFLLEQGKILKAMHDLRSDILKEQMEYFGKHTQNVRVVVTNIIIELLKEANIDEIHYGTYFANFENFMEVCESKLQTKFRQMCRDNHFSSYSIFEYKEITNRNIAIIEGMVKDLLRKRYPQRQFIKNFNRIYNAQPVIRTALKDCFEYGRDIALERENKVRQAKECFEKQVSEVIGMKYSLEI